ncbi:MAG: serine/threonine-protein kinase [Cyanobacteriota/Melainabacteria group bacterium]
MALAKGSLNSKNTILNLPEIHRKIVKEHGRQEIRVNLEIGSVVFEKFEILEPLGSGGMATVYKANHIHLDKVVVLKMLHTEGLSDRAMVRFHKEAKILSQLNHPNISPFFDFGLSEDNIPYLAIEFLQGKTLKDKLKADDYLDLEECLSIVLDLAGALAHAHAKGIIHRDVKPANVMVTETDDITRAVLMDFGIARLMEPDAEDQSLTSSGELVGSPRYMSPEQGESGKKVDERTDQYSLGCLIFEMLTGNVPLSGDTAFDTIKMRQTQEAPRLSEMSLSEIPQALDDLVARLLAREPANRFASMKEVTTIAENLLDEIVSSANQGTNEEEKKETPLLNLWAPDIQELLRAKKIQLMLAGTLALAALCLAGNIFFTSTKRSKQANVPLKTPTVGAADMPILSPNDEKNTNKNNKEFDLRSLTDLKTLSKAKDYQVIKIRNFPNLNLDDLAALAGHDNLIELYIRPNQYRFKSLANIAALKNLLFLEIKGMPLEDRLLKDLSENKSLQALNVTDCGLTAYSARHIKNIRNLKTLYVDDHLLDSPEFKQLSKELPDCTILGIKTVLKNNSTIEFLTDERFEKNPEYNVKEKVSKEGRKIDSPLKELQSDSLKELNKLPATAKDTIQKKIALFEKCRKMAINAQGPDCSAARHYLRDIAGQQHIGGDSKAALDTIAQIERSIAREGDNFEEVETLALKSDILWVTGKQKESIELVKKAIPLAKKRELYQRFTVPDLLERLITRYAISKDQKKAEDAIEQQISWLDQWHEKKEEGYGYYLIVPLRYNCDMAEQTPQRKEAIHKIGNKIVDWFIGLGGDNSHGKMFLQQRTYDTYIETEARLATASPDRKGQRAHLEKALQAIGNATGVESRNPVLCYQCYITLGRIYGLDGEKNRGFTLFERARRLLPLLPPSFSKAALEQINNEEKVLRDG